MKEVKEMRLKFKKKNQDSYEVFVVIKKNKDKVKAGQLAFSPYQDTWNFCWDGDQSPYKKSLKESMQELKDIFEMGQKDPCITKFGDYRYND